MPTADGLFTLDHIPDEVEARIIVHGLPDDCAQEAARTSRDGLALVRVVAGATVEGRVLDQLSQPVPGALVWIGENPAVRADSRGYYRLIQNLPGAVTITAQKEKGKGSRTRRSIGKRAVQLEPNGHQVDIDILLDR